MNIEVRCSLECRADSTRQGPGRISGTILQTGRVAGDRPEVFAPGSVRLPTNGIALLLEHRGRQFMRTLPVESGSELRIDAALPDTAEGREAARLVRSGERSNLSIEFHPLAEATVSGVREIRSALVDAAALVSKGAYVQAAAEVRHRRQRRHHADQVARIYL